MIHPIRRTRQFVHNHPVVATSAVFTVGWIVGTRTCANQYQDFLRELDPSGALIDQFFDTEEI